MRNIPRMNLHLRTQHGVLLLAVVTAMVTGHGMDSALLPAGVRFDLWYRAHIWSGLGAGAVIVYHIFYLLVRGYVEGIQWPSFALAWRGEDWKKATGQMGYLWGGGEPPEAAVFRVSQKALYWGTAVLVCGLALTGLFVTFWEHLGGHSPLSSFDLIAHLHRGIGLLLLAVLLWHLYGALTWKGSWRPQWTWLTGYLPEDLAREKVPGFYRKYLESEEKQRGKGGHGEGAEQAEREVGHEREAVEEDLQEGNRLAREEKFVDALYYFKRALERYPGYSQARYNQAVVLRKMGERAMAVEDFRRFLRDDPFHPLARQAQEFISELEEEAEA
jgi:cytochrome b subunit of formate dehydrogenase